MPLHAASTSAALVPQITGHTDVYIIIGDPVAQVRAPETFNRLFALLGIPAVLIPMQVAPENLADFVKSIFQVGNVKGLWVTMPHKTPLLPLLDSCSTLAQAAGAVNAVRRNPDGRLEGGLFDGEGFVAGLRHDHIAYAGKKALILGAGGAASAIAVSLALRSGDACAEIALYDPTPGRAQALANRIAQTSPVKVYAAEHNDPAGFDLVINGSPLGLRATDPLPCDVNRLADGAAFADILMKNQPTPVVRAVRSRGLVAQPGFEMMIQQTSLYLEFFGLTAAATVVRQDATFLRELIYPAELQSDIRRTG